MKILHEFYLKSSDRMVRLTTTHLLISADRSYNYFGHGTRFSATRKEVKRVLTSKKKIPGLYYQDWNVPGNIATVIKFKVDVNFGCQQFCGSQARLLRKWAMGAK